MFCFECGVWLGGYNPSVEIDGEMYCEDCAFEVEHQREIIAEVKKELRLRKAYPEMYDGVMYEQMMSDAGRGYLVRGKS